MSGADSLKTENLGKRNVQCCLYVDPAIDIVHGGVASVQTYGDEGGGKDDCADGG